MDQGEWKTKQTRTQSSRARTLVCLACLLRVQSWLGIPRCLQPDQYGNASMDAIQVLNERGNVTKLSNERAGGPAMEVR